MPPHLEVLVLKGNIRAGESAASVVGKLQELLSEKEVYMRDLRMLVVRDMGGEFRCWEEAEKVVLREACLERGVMADFRSEWEMVDES